TNELSPEQEGMFGIGPQMPWYDSTDDQMFHANRHAASLYASPTESSLTASSKHVFRNKQIFAVGGKQNLWGGVSLRFSPRNFRGRDYGDSDTNWPFGYDELEPHYTAVERLITVCGTHEQIEDLPDGEFVPPKPMRPADELLLKALKKVGHPGLRAIPIRKAVETRKEVPHHCRSCGICIFGCRSGSVYKFGSRLLPRISGLQNYRLRTHCKVVRLVRETGSDRLGAAECIDTETRKTFQVRATKFVLSAGAMESPRILFNSRDEQFVNGLANRSNLVGCYLQDNVKVTVGSPLLRLFGSRGGCDIGFGDNMIVPRFLFDNTDFRGGFQAQYCNFLPTRPFQLQSIGEVRGRRILEWGLKKIFHSYAALLFFGQPDARRENRLVPSHEPDAFGVPQVAASHSWSDNDRRMQASMGKWGKRILSACSGLSGLVQVDETAGNAIHYSGTCRMSSTATEGVVDANLQSFDHPNLSICDSSVFPDLSEKNLTLTIMALANRLAERLKRQSKQ
ncbi:MAG: GMC family oxidoreductase, partial [Fuerstiella sp.]|nr:GMC family oxidoreductase [Fuerstiella sp.]